jgi:hypothetical protein
MSLLEDYRRHLQLQERAPGHAAIGELALLPGSRRIGGEPKREARKKTWEISPTFHCSIIGTCLTAGELRQVLAKTGEPDARTATDHALHGRGVRAASERGVAGKLLNKALDRRHETMIRRFSRLSAADDVRALWNDCLEKGEIAGAYWAVMSHPATDRALIQDVFGEVHMLSHLVGSSNRLDIARLRTLQAEVDGKQDTIARHEERLAAGADERTRLQRRIDELEESLIAVRAVKSVAEDGAGSSILSAARHRFEAERERADTLAARLAEMQERLNAAEKHAAALVEQNAALQREADSLEAAFAGGLTETAPTAVAGASILYVGGRRNLFDRMRLLASQHGIALTIHDGGIEDNNSLLPGLVGQAATAVFPVDCISHAAAGMVKRLCRDSGKPFVPLRSASLASFLATIGAPMALTDP